MMLVLFALIFRAVSMEFRAHDETRAGIWEKAFFAGSALAALLFGVALGNVVYGVPLDNRTEFTGNFFTLLRPVPLLFGVTGFAAILLQGASYAVMKTEGELQEEVISRGWNSDMGKHYNRDSLFSDHGLYVSGYHVKLVILSGCFMDGTVAFGNFIFRQT